MCYGFKYLKNKPVRDLKGDQFLRIVQAEQDGLLITAIRIDLDTSSDGRSFSTYYDEIKQYFFRVCCCAHAFVTKVTDFLIPG